MLNKFRRPFKTRVPSCIAIFGVSPKYVNVCMFYTVKMRKNIAEIICNSQRRVFRSKTNIFANEFYQFMIRKYCKFTIFSWFWSKILTESYFWYRKLKIHVRFSKIGSQLDSCPNLSSQLHLSSENGQFKKVVWNLQISYYFSI